MAARYLYRRLTSNGLRSVFFDKEEMLKAQNISRQIIEAIGGASVHIAIFSPRYAESWWCLDGLVLMAESGKAILPVFYKVDPSVVRHNVKAGAYADTLRDIAKKTTPANDLKRYGYRCLSNSPSHTLVCLLKVDEREKRFKMPIPELEIS